MTLNKHSDFFANYFSDFESHETVDVVEFGLGYVPYFIERISDGEKLKLNKDNKTYSFVSKELRRGLPGGHGYTWGRLFRDNRSTGAFIATSWVKIENLESAHKAFEDI